MSRRVGTNKNEANINQKDVRRRKKCHSKEARLFNTCHEIPTGNRKQEK